jgi:hypothetical protein
MAGIKKTIWIYVEQLPIKNIRIITQLNIIQKVNSWIKIQFSSK